MKVLPDGAIELRPTEAALIARRSGGRRAEPRDRPPAHRRGGVAEPTIQRVGADRILVQLPGVQDPTAIRTLLGSTAKLSFHRVLDGGWPPAPACRGL